MKVRSKIWDLISKEERDLKLSYGDSELDFTGMAFEENYLAVAKYLPKNYAVIDLGCYQFMDMHDEILSSTLSISCRENVYYIMSAVPNMSAKIHQESKGNVRRCIYPNSQIDVTSVASRKEYSNLGGVA